MAKTAPINPWVIRGPTDRQTRRAKDSQTWKAGQPCYQDSVGLYAPCASDEVNVKGIFCSDQVASTSSSDVDIAFITADTVFHGYISNGDADIAASIAYEGNQYAMLVGSNIMTVDVADASNVCCKINKCFYLKETAKATSSDTPAIVEFQYLASVIDAV